MNLKIAHWTQTVRGAQRTKKSEDREGDDMFKILKELIKERKLPTKNTLSGKVVFQNWRKDKDTLKQTKTEGVHHH